MLKCLDQWSDRLNITLQQKKDRWLRPLIIFLRRLGLTADILSGLKVVMAGGATLWAKDNLTMAAIVFIAVYFLDLFDGSMARYQGNGSDRGKFIDVITDQAVYALAVLALIRVELLDVGALAYNLLLLPFLYILVIVERNEDKSTDWIIKPVAKLTGYKIPVCAAALAVVFGWWSKETANWILYWTNFCITWRLIYAYSRILRRK